MFLEHSQIWGPGQDLADLVKKGHFGGPKKRLKSAHSKGPQDPQKGPKLPVFDLFLRVFSEKVKKTHTIGPN